MSYGEEKLYSFMDEVVNAAQRRLAKDLGIDPNELPSLRHMYDSDGVYRGDISENERTDAYHYGTPRHSGRYPWGSGDNPYQRNESFLGKVAEMKKAVGPDGKKLFNEKQIAAAMNMNTSDLRKRISLANAENRAYLSSEAKRLRAKGMSPSAIARRMGKNESSVRLLLDEEVNERMSKTARNATLLKERVEKYNYIDIGKGEEQYLGLTPHSFGTTIKMLENEGYTVHTVPVEQLGTGQQTTVKVLAKPGVEWKEVMNNRDKIKLVDDLYSEDAGRELKALKAPVSVDPKRVMVNYAETGGKDKDGVIELRRGVEDLSLGDKRYAQVRIMVDNTHYLKGMAMYADETNNPLPPGIDIRFNTNKHSDVPMIDKEHPKDCVLKPIKDEFENPFGANIKSQRGALNIVSEEGTWDDWNRTLASQFLSKQSTKLAEQQLKMAYDISKSDFDEICAYNNPVVKSVMLEDFARRCESDAVHLAAAALPRQTTSVLLPFSNIGENEIYDPNHRDGEKVALVRYPHASITEIPILTVNNNNKLAKELIGSDAIDAVGISPKAAQRLSGADFDGDTAIVIPVDNVKIKTAPQFKNLKDIDLEELYPRYEGMHEMTSREKGIEMGKITNLITDMTFQAAPAEELERALRHSMVVIDAEKHKLDYKRSERENGIQELKDKYQGGGGAHTLLSRSTSDVRDLPERKEKAPSKMTPAEKERYLNGEMIYENTNRKIKITDFPRSRMTKAEKAIMDGNDEEAQRQVRAAMIADGRVKRSEKLATTTIEKGYLFNPYELASGGSKERTTDMERVYAEHALAMKELARQARKVARNQEKWDADPVAKKQYADEVESLNTKLSVALRNAPLERQAQLKANAAMDDILEKNPDLKNDKEHYKRERFRQLDHARTLVGAKKLVIGGSDKNPLTDKEWEAIEHHAVSKSTLLKILSNADKGRVRELAMPKEHHGLAPAKIARAKAMLASGYSRADVCDMLDISMNRLVEEVGTANS